MIFICKFFIGEIKQTGGIHLNDFFGTAINCLRRKIFQEKLYEESTFKLNQNHVKIEKAPQTSLEGKKGKRCHYKSFVKFDVLSMEESVWHTRPVLSLHSIKFWPHTTDLIPNDFPWDFPFKILDIFSGINFFVGNVLSPAMFPSSPLFVPSKNLRRSSSLRNYAVTLLLNVHILKWKAIKFS